MDAGTPHGVECEAHVKMHSIDAGYKDQDLLENTVAFGPSARFSGSFEGGSG